MSTSDNTSSTVIDISDDEYDENDPANIYPEVAARGGVRTNEFTLTPDEKKEEYAGYIVLVRPPQPTAPLYMIRVFDQHQKLIADGKDSEVRLYPINGGRVGTEPVDGGSMRECVWHTSPHHMYQIIYCRGDPSKEKVICEFGGRNVLFYTSM